MKLFYLTHNASGDSSVSFEGMGQETVEKLLSESGKTFEFTDEKGFNSFNELHQPTPRTQPDLTQEKATLKDITARPDDRINALVKILGL